MDTTMLEARSLSEKRAGSTESDMPAATEEDDFFDSDCLQKLKPVDPRAIRKAYPTIPLQSVFEQRP